MAPKGSLAQCRGEEKEEVWVQLVSVFRKEWELNLCLDSHPTLSGKEIDIGMDKGCDKALRPTDMLLYSQDRRLDVCVDLTESSPLTQTRMAISHAVRSGDVDSSTT
ncbi:hypothetical protein Tco_0378400 [Tanacetum coccineum]